MLITKNNIQQIKEILVNYNIKEFGLLTGNSGITLFLYYYSLYKYDKNCNDKIIFLLQKILMNINNGNSQYSFCNGISGFLGVLDILIAKKILEKKDADFITELNIYFFLKNVNEN